MKKILLICTLLLTLTLVFASCDILNGLMPEQDTTPSTHDHEFGEWKIVKVATDKEDGLKERSCACGEKETEILQKGSEGIVYEMRAHGLSCFVRSLGTCTDTDVVILSSYEGVPVTEIVATSFSGGKDIVSITIPDTVTYIETDAFNSCTSLTDIIVDADSEHFSSINGNLCTKDGKTLLKYPKGKTDAELVIPNTVTAIGNEAIAGCTALMQAVIPNTVTAIGIEAFANCTALMKVVIPKSVVTMGDGVFSDCTNVIVYCEAESRPDTWGGYWSDRNDGYEYYNQDLTVVWDCNNNDIATDGYGYVWVDGILYAVKDGNATVIKPHRYDVTDVVIPSSITYKDVVYSVTTIGKDAFYACTKLESVTIPDSVTTIGESAFSWCYNLESVTIPDSVTTIDEAAFSCCYDLTSIIIPDSVTSIGSYTFNGCYDLTSIIIPDSVTTVGYNAFYNCTRLVIYCESKSKPSAWDADWASGSDYYGNRIICPVVWDCNNNEIATDGKIYAVIDGVRYSLKDNCATVERQARNIAEANIPSLVVYKDAVYSVTTICDSAFYDCYNLTNITIPDSVTTIGEYAFYNCTNLTSIIIPDSVTYIGECAFASRDIIIYCEAESQPSGWDLYWNYSEVHNITCTVVWGYKG